MNAAKPVDQARGRALSEQEPKYPADSDIETESPDDLPGSSYFVVREETGSKHLLYRSEVSESHSQRVGRFLGGVAPVDRKRSIKEAVSEAVSHR